MKFTHTGSGALFFPGPTSWCAGVARGPASGPHRRIRTPGEAAKRGFNAPEATGCERGLFHLPAPFRPRPPLSGLVSLLRATRPTISLKIHTPVVPETDSFRLQERPLHQRSVPRAPGA